eukprot:s2117_g7.t1
MLETPRGKRLPQRCSHGMALPKSTADWDAALPRFWQVAPVSMHQSDVVAAEAASLDKTASAVAMAAFNVRRTTEGSKVGPGSSRTFQAPLGPASSDFEYKQNISFRESMIYGPKDSMPPTAAPGSAVGTSWHLGIRLLRPFPAVAHHVVTMAIMSIFEVQSFKWGGVQEFM